MTFQALLKLSAFACMAIAWVFFLKEDYKTASILWAYSGGAYGMLARNLEKQIKETSTPESDGPKS